MDAETYVASKKGAERSYSEDGLQNDLYNLSESLSSLERAFDALREHAHPVTRPEPIVDGENNLPTANSVDTRSLVRSDVWRLQNRISDLITQVHNLDSRLEL